MEKTRDDVKRESLNKQTLDSPQRSARYLKGMQVPLIFVKMLLEFCFKTLAK